MEREVNYFNKAKYFENVLEVEMFYGKMKKIQSFLIILNIFSFFVSLVIFDYRNNEEILDSIQTDNTNNLIASIQDNPLEFFLIFQSVINFSLIILELKHLSMEINILNQTKINFVKQK